MRRLRERPRPAPGHTRPGRVHPVPPVAGALTPGLLPARGKEPKEGVWGNLRGWFPQDQPTNSAEEPDFLAVVDSKRSLHSAEDRLVQSRTALTLHTIRLFKALGGGRDGWAGPR